MMIQKLSKKAREYKVKADQAYSQMKWKKALDFYIKCSQEAPGDSRIEQRIGDLYRRLKMNSEATEQYKAVAFAYAKDGFWAKAIAISKIILEIDPNDTSVQQSLAKMYAAQSTQAQTLPETFPVPASDTRRAGEREPIPLSEDDGPSLDSKVPDMASLGATLSVSGLKPRSMGDEPEIMDTGPEFELGTPIPGGRSIPLFSEMSADELMAVLERLAVRNFPAGALICEEGDLGRSMYILSEGSVEVFAKAADGKRIVLGHLSGGDFFGEFGLLVSGRRNASVQAKTSVEVMEITSTDFDFIAAGHPRIWIVLEDYLQRRMIDTILQKSPVFGSLSGDDRARLTQLMKKRKISADEVVMAEETAGEEMYFVRSGRLAVMIRRGRDLVVVGELSAGEYFGEVAMLTGKPRTATVKAKTDTELFCLSRQDAAKVFKGNRELLVRLRAKMEERAKETSAVFEAYQEARTTLELV